MLPLGWVDLLFVIIIVRVYTDAKKSGMFVEFFKLIGLFISICVTMHYYSSLGEFFNKRFFIPQEISDFFAFCLMSFGIYCLFVVVADSWFDILNFKLKAKLDRYLGLFFSYIRMYWLGGMAVFLVLLTGNIFIVKNTKNSLSFALCAQGPVATYKFVHHQFISSIFFAEEINKKPFLVVEKEEEVEDDE